MNCNFRPVDSTRRATGGLKFRQFAKGVEDGRWFAMLRRAVLGTPAGRRLAPRPGRRSHGADSQRIPARRGGLRSIPLPAQCLFPGRLALDLARRAVERYAELHRRARCHGFQQLAQPDRRQRLSPAGRSSPRQLVCRGRLLPLRRLDLVAERERQRRGLQPRPGRQLGGRKLHQRQHLFLRRSRPPPTSPRRRTRPATSRAWAPAPRS